MVSLLCARGRNRTFDLCLTCPTRLDVVGVPGIEPGTSVLSGLRSTTELYARYGESRRAGQDSVLPLNYTRIFYGVNARY